MFGYEMDRERIPCLYEILYRKRTEKNPPCIVLRLHEEFVEANKDLSQLDFFIRKLRDDHKLGEFSSLSDDYFGFDNAIRRKEKDPEGFIVYEIEIPVFRVKTSEPCERCGGTGWDDGLDSKCLSCRGGKNKISFNWKPLYSISASLQVLSLMMDIFDKKELIE